MKKLAFLSGIAQKIVVNEVILGKESGFENNHKVAFDIPGTENPWDRTGRLGVHPTIYTQQDVSRKKGPFFSMSFDSIPKIRQIS